MNFDLFEKMVRIPSPSGEERELALLLVKELIGREFRCSIDEAGNFIAVKGKGSPFVLLTAHMDTVPKQLPVKRTATKIFGRGAVDTKASLYSFIEAASSTKTENGTIMIAGTVEEECPTNKGAYFLSKTVKPDYCIVGEPSHWNSITIGYKGLLDFSYFLQLPESHYSSGSNASLEFLNFINSLRKEFEFENSFSAPSIEIRKIESDSSTVNARIVLRVPPEFNIPEGRDKIKELAGKAKLHWQQEIPAALMPKNTPLTRAFLAEIRALGGKPAFTKKTGTSDMNIFSLHWDCAMLTYGPGDSHLDHSDEEHIELAEIEKSVQVLEGVLARILRN